jgi:hypothetical protein
MIDISWPFYLEDGFNTEKGLTRIEEYLYNNVRGEIVRNVAVLEKMNPIKTRNWPCNLSDSFDLGVKRESSSGSWENGLYVLTCDEVTQADLPDKVVVEFTYKGVLFVIEKEVEITPEMFTSEPTPQDITVQSLNQTYILDSNSLLNAWKKQQPTGKFLMAPFVVSGDVVEKWETTWTDGNPSKDNVPTKVVMTVIDDIGLTYTAEESNITSMPAGATWEDLFPSD